MSNTTQPDIFLGSYVQVSLNRDITSEDPGYFDPGYIYTENLAGFPQVALDKEVKGFEAYNEDFERKLSGNVAIKDTTLSVMSVPNDPFVEELDQALLEKRPLRFRNLYVIDSENGERAQSGVYHIFDALVTKKETTGNANSVVVDNFTLSPVGKLTQGFAEVGEILREGMYGLGAGTERIPGVYDIGALSGNRWVTVDASNSQNPFGSDTSLMAIQHPNNVGWELIGQTTGNSALRVRSKQLVGDEIKSGKWVKIYSETEKPTAAEVGALSTSLGGKVAGTVTFDGLTIFNQKITAKDIQTGTLNTTSIKSTNSETETLTANVSIKTPLGTIDQVKSKSVKVNDKEVYHLGNKPTPEELGVLPADAVIAVDFGYF
ncbi:TPA: hypothetical protein N2299_001816 [Enterobacter hormaechei]|uniref:hypothetical protein n=1 Tax=Enterobacter cloacae complex TaxID=354276 RepID=UPI001DD3EC6A|nr:hypothetical protein [Enterobacter cloacae complex sp. 2022EL-00747]ELD3451338.1 hypothetical protein [Enterobacter hormaechei]CAE6319607.1 hypothetical protein AI2716V1_0369 [Enterobacter cloacae]MCY0805993.1 hypothetical protein [Enterobacter cloacae complex sp. 2022EL-00747]CAH3341454.1 hypothetical protein AI2716V1_0369 [Enterobacter cloacae]HCL9444333.1 hypothetical protein [Enterobacter hormaechei]